MDTLMLLFIGGSIYKYTLIITGIVWLYYVIRYIIYGKEQPNAKS
jgi:hypothetical protein